MESLPDAIVQSIFAYMSNAKDVAVCSSVSRRWKDSMRYISSLYFPRSSFDNYNGGEHSDTIVWRMVAAVVRLEELVVYSPFTSRGLASWLLLAGSSLRQLELRMDNIAEYQQGCSSETLTAKLDCLAYARSLESVKLWGVVMMDAPKWNVFPKLQSLQIVGARLEDSALASALRACPDLKTLVLLGCEGSRIVSIELPRLQECRVDFYGAGSCSFTLNAPRVEVLEVQGCRWIRVREAQCLKNLTISNNAGRVYMVDFGKLDALESLTMRGIQWCWDAIRKMLQCASEVKQLFMKVEFTGDFDSLDPFPEVDFVDFFNSHLKLQKFDIHGAMFASLCNKDSLRNLDSGFVIPSLEEVVVTVRSPLKAEQKISTLESLLKHGKNMKRMVIRILQMKSSHSSADDFFDDIFRFQRLNRKIVRIE